MTQWMRNIFSKFSPFHWIRFDVICALKIGIESISLREIKNMVWACKYCKCSSYITFSSASGQLYGQLLNQIYGKNINLHLSFSFHLLFSFKKKNKFFAFYLAESIRYGREKSIHLKLSTALYTFHELWTECLPTLAHTKRTAKKMEKSKQHYKLNVRDRWPQCKVFALLASGKKQPSKTPLLGDNERKKKKQICEKMCWTVGKNCLFIVLPTKSATRKWNRFFVVMFFFCFFTHTTKVEHTH